MSKNSGTTPTVAGLAALALAAAGFYGGVEVQKGQDPAGSAGGATARDRQKVHPGDTVVVTGKTASSGTVTATHVTAAAS